jgi:Predicted transcriptional regulator
MVKVNLDLMMVKRGVSSKDLAKAIGITPANLSILKTGKAKGIRFATLDKICEVLDCQPGDILEHTEGNEMSKVEAEKLDKANRTELMNLIRPAYNNVKDPKFSNFKIQLVQFSKEIEDGEDLIKIMLGLRTAILQADLSLKLKERISSLPKEYRDIYYFVEPQLKKVDSEVIDRYNHYGFVPLRFGSTVKYD